MNLFRGLIQDNNITNIGDVTFDKDNKRLSFSGELRDNANLNLIFAINNIEFNFSNEIIHYIIRINKIIMLRHNIINGSRRYLFQISTLSEATILLGKYGVTSDQINRFNNDFPNGATLEYAASIVAPLNPSYRPPAFSLKRGIIGGIDSSALVNGECFFSTYGHFFYDGLVDMSILRGFLGDVPEDETIATISFASSTSTNVLQAIFAIKRLQETNYLSTPPSIILQWFSTNDIFIDVPSFNIIDNDITTLSQAISFYNGLNYLYAQAPHATVGTFKASSVPDLENIMQPLLNLSE